MMEEWNNVKDFLESLKKIESSIHLILWEVFATNTNICVTAIKAKVGYFESN